MVYSAAKPNRTIDLHWAKSPDVGLPKPDRVVFLDLEPEEAEKRGGYGEEKYEKREMQENVRRLFLDLQYCRDDEAKDMKIVNAGSSVEDVGELIWEAVKRKVIEVQKGNGELERVRAWKWGTDYTSFQIGDAAEGQNVKGKDNLC